MADITIDLNHPIKLLGKEAASLTLREPIVEDLMAMDAQAGAMGKLAALISSCAQVPMVEIKKMHSSDLGAAGKALKPFLTFLDDPEIG
jgi:hypothetical protein